MNQTYELSCGRAGFEQHGILMAKFTLFCVCVCDLFLYFSPACEQSLFSRFDLSFLFRSLTGRSDSWSQSRGAVQQNNRLLSPLLFHSLTLSLSSGSRLHWASWTERLMTQLPPSLSHLACFVWCCHCDIEVSRLIIVCLFWI